MSLIVNTSNAKIHWISSKSNGGTLSESQGIIYQLADSNKLGQATSTNSYTGLTPEQVVCERYKNQSGDDKDKIVNDIFVIDKIYGDNYLYDNEIRAGIHKLKNILGFDALFPGYQVSNNNEESLIGYDRSKHFDKLEKVIKQYYGINEYYNTRQDFLPRFGQGSAIAEAVDKLKNNQRALLAAYTAFGKTVSGLEIAHKSITNGGLILVTTPVKDTIDGFIEELDPLTGKRFGNNPARRSAIITSADFIKFNGTAKQFVKSLTNRTAKGELIFILLTVQDLRYQDNGYNKIQRKDIRKKYERLSGNLNLWIRDERHKEYEGQITKETFKMLDSDMILDLTATPYKIAELYSNEDIVDRSLLWAIANRQDTKIPEIKIDVMSSAFKSLPKELQSVYDTSEGWNPRKFFEAERIKNDYIFSQQRGLEKLFFDAYLNPTSKKKNPISVVNDRTLSPISKNVGLWVLPQGSANIGSADYLPALAELWNAMDPQTKVIDSYTLEKNYKSLSKHYNSLGDYVEYLSQDQRVVIITCEKFLTGTNIPKLGHIVLMNSIRDISKFEQLVGRMVRIYPNKDNPTKNVVKMYSYCPGVEIENTLAKWAVTASNISSTVEPTEFLDCISITEYNNLSPQPINADAIIKVYQDQLKELENPPVYSIENKLSTSGLSGHWDDVPLLKKGKQPSTNLSDDNGSKVKEPSKKAGQPPKAKGKTTSDKSVAENIGVILKESIPFAYSHNIWKPTDILRLPELALLVAAENINALIDAINQEPGLESLISTWYTNVKVSIHNLPLEDVYEKIFINSSLKAKKGLVYVPFDLAYELVDKLPKNKYNRILIPNALSGTLAMVAREKYPDAEIVCAEVFDYFVPHLTRLGFKVVKWNSKEFNKLTEQKFDIIIGNPPYQGADRTNKIWQHFLEKSHSVLKPNGSIAFITPSVWVYRNGSKTKKARKIAETLGLKYLNLTTSKFFPNIGEDICSFILGPCDKTSLVAHNGNYELISPTINDLVKITRDSRQTSIMEKIENIDHSKLLLKRDLQSRPLVDDGTLSKTKNSKFKYKIWHTASQVYYTDKLYGDQNKLKVIINISGNYYHNETPEKYIFISNDMSGKGTQHILIKDKTEGKNLIKILHSKIFRFYIEHEKTSGFTTGLPKLPSLDTSHTWTDGELYKHFNLTQEEIDYIEANVK